jgi:hypothetical protein
VDLSPAVFAEYGIATTACLPQALGGGSPLDVPAERWRVLRPGERDWTIDAAPPARYGDRRVAWFRFRFDPPHTRLDGWTYDAHYNWTMIDCATSRMRNLRIWYVDAGAVVDSLHGVDAESEPIQPTAYMSEMIRAVCEGPYLPGATPSPPPGELSRAPARGAAGDGLADGVRRSGTFAREQHLEPVGVLLVGGFAQAAHPRGGFGALELLNPR